MSRFPTIVQIFDSLPTTTPTKPNLSAQELLDVDDAISHLSKKVKENSHLVDEYIELGRLFRKKGEYQKAFLLHRNLLVRDDLRRDQLARVYGELGYDYLCSKTRDSGESYFIQSINLNKESQYMLEGLYQCYRQTFELEKAADKLRAIVKILPERKKDLAVLLSEIALKKAENNQMSSAKKCVGEAFEFDEESPLAYLTKAHLESMENKRKNAIETLEAFIQKWPNSTLFALKKIETLYYEMNQYSSYAYTLNKCIQKNPQNFYAHHALGKYLVKIRKGEEAIQHFEKALDLCPFSIQSLKEIIHIHTQKKNMQGALATIETFLSYLPDQRGFSCPRCHEGFSDLSRDCPICKESRHTDPEQITRHSAESF